VRRILDISRPVRAGIPVWPGDTPFEYRRSWKIGGGCPVNVGQVTMSLHTGAHTDAPYHFDDAGAAIADVDLAKYLGPCVVVDARPAAARAGGPPRGHRRLRGAPRLLVRHVRRASDGVRRAPAAPGRPRWPTGWRRAGSCSWGGQRLMDAFDSKELAAHHRLASHGIAILEGIDLGGDAGRLRPVALPLRLGADASPVRAVLVTREG
jgi:arylformamidase